MRTDNVVTKMNINYHHRVLDFHLSAILLKVLYIQQI